ncbi:hypothetical protein AVEN_15628-1 [Araneus ventricosus]|uniref:Uncharacterized protein n=1 Tax=Araneus ventricosus TaxID=182803 RepID=A0A4Y2KQT5_ARAVE|nr:hypothetical protein AVEN_15628-1 [Araneus ventricosus]
MESHFQQCRSYGWEEGLQGPLFPVPVLRVFLYICGNLHSPIILVKLDCLHHTPTGRFSATLVSEGVDKCMVKTRSQTKMAENADLLRSASGEEIYGERTRRNEKRTRRNEKGQEEMRKDKKI